MPPPPEQMVIVCELCRPAARIPCTRAQARTVRIDHALDFHAAAMIAVPVTDRARFLHRMFRITNQLGRPQRLPL